MKDYISIGKIDKKQYREITKKKIMTEEVILTIERLQHILEKHKEDYEIFCDRIAEIISNPDYILKDSKNENTAMIIKHIEKTNVNVIIRLAVEKDEIHCKNSIMTLYRIRDKNLKKLMERNKIVYKKE